MRILIVRTSALGDVVHALPVLTALRRQLPEAKIGWVVEEPMAPLLEGHPDLDALLVVRLRQWRRSLRSPAIQNLRELRAFLSALDRFAPDAVLDLMGNHKAGVISALTLADRRIGFARSARREPSSAIWISQPVVPRGAHAVDRMLSLLDALGLPAEPADFGPEKLFREEPAAVRDAAGEPFVLLHPGAGWANKRYPPAWWGEAARRLHAAAGVPIRVAVARGEEELAAGVQAAGGEAVRTVPAPDLRTLAALIRRARLMLGGDSGPTHLAHALGTPVLMVMGPTDPERSGPYGAPDHALYRRLPCSFCYKRFGETKACLLEVPPRRVAERAAEILAH
ncbi:MAG TPA: lipopolysaccharide heptosyltransferase I [Thermoanaerobaculia bacterium]|nr:lipopolysaccharide heptosyltransferase I [Thermoanaerobaculia bacterium]